MKDNEPGDVQCDADGCPLRATYRLEREINVAAENEPSRWQHDRMLGWFCAKHADVAAELLGSRPDG